MFFFEPRQRKPLKKGIVADLQKEGSPEAHELLARAVDWYQSHFGYLYALQAGAKRINLHGKEVGTVTEQEHYAAQIQIKQAKQRLDERNRNDSVKNLLSLHANARISTDHIKKLDAPPLAKPKEAPMKAKYISSTAPELEQVYEAVAAANALMTGERDALRSAMAAAALGVVINEAQRVINRFQEKDQ
jgi:sRNA-binding protein